MMLPLRPFLRRSPASLLIACALMLLLADMLPSPVLVVASPVAAAAAEATATASSSPACGGSNEPADFSKPGPFTTHSLTFAQSVNSYTVDVVVTHPSGFAPQQASSASVQAATASGQPGGDVGGSNGGKGGGFWPWSNRRRCQRRSLQEAAATGTAAAAAGVNCTGAGGMPVPQAPFPVVWMFNGFQVGVGTVPGGRGLHRSFYVSSLVGAPRSGPGDLAEAVRPSGSRSVCLLIHMRTTS